MAHLIIIAKILIGLGIGLVAGFILYILLIWIVVTLND